MKWWAPEELTGTGLGSGTAELGFVGYDPSKARERAGQMAFAQVEFLTPRSAVPTPVPAPISPAAGF